MSDRLNHEDRGWQPLYEFEDILCRLSNATLLTPRRRSPIRHGGRLRRRILSEYKPISVAVNLHNSTVAKVLLVVAPTPRGLDMVRSIPMWRSKFDIIACYICDSYHYDQYPAHTQLFDHLFVPIQESVEPVAAAHNVPVHLLPFGADVLHCGCVSNKRPIDIMAYGRQPTDFTDAFAKYYNSLGNGRIFLHSTTKRHYVPDWKQDRAVFWKLLRRSQVALAFDTLIQGAHSRTIPFSILTPRWFECLAAGCVVVGKRPRVPLASELLNWSDAIIDLPETPKGAIKFVDDLLCDQRHLNQIRKKNINKMASSHDWRFRIEMLFNTLQIPIPQSLQNELSLLNQMLSGM